MRIRAATVEDAPAISSFDLELSDPFYSQPDRSGAELFTQSVGEAAERRYLGAENFKFLVATTESELVGVGALRDGSHLFHLFVAEPFQRKGLARQLWGEIAEESLRQGRASRFTVNASLNAVAVYERFGFLPVEKVVSAHGVCFQPMAFEVPRA